MTQGEKRAQLTVTATPPPPPSPPPETRTIPTAMTFSRTTVSGLRQMDTFPAQKLPGGVSTATLANREFDNAQGTVRRGARMTRTRQLPLAAILRRELLETLMGALLAYGRGNRTLTVSEPIVLKHVLWLLLNVLGWDEPVVCVLVSAHPSSWCCSNDDSLLL